MECNHNISLVGLKEMGFNRPTVSGNFGLFSCVLEIVTGQIWLLHQGNHRFISILDAPALHVFSPSLVDGWLHLPLELAPFAIPGRRRWPPSYSTQCRTHSPRGLQAKREPVSMTQHRTSATVSPSHRNPCLKFMTLHRAWTAIKSIYTMLTFEAHDIT